MSTPDRRPNIVMIVADQLRYDCVGYRNPERIRTPHIDALAAQGRWFDQAFCAIPVCCPARQSLLTGRRAESFGALWNFDIALPVGSLHPAMGIPTWPAMLQAAGYATAFVGKWHGSQTHNPTAFGFDSYDPLDDYAAYRAAHYPEYRVGGDWRGAVDPIPTIGARTHWLARRAIQHISSLADTGRPFHLRVDFPEPHLPSRPTAEFAERYAAAAIEPWPSFSDDLAGKPAMQARQLTNWGVESYTWEDWAPTVARYLAMVEQLDDAVGNILRHLHTCGLDDNSLIVFTTDHGDMCGSHRMVDKHYVMYDDITRVPLVVRPAMPVPGEAATGSAGTGRPPAAGSRCCHELVDHLLDLGPTLLETAGLKPDPGMHGRSFAPLLAAGDAEADDAHGRDVRGREFVVATYNGQQFGLYTQRMIRTHRYKYVWNATDTDEFYDLADDPWEMHNRIDEYRDSDIGHSLRNRLLAELRRTGDGITKGQWIERHLGAPVENEVPPPKA